MSRAPKITIHPVSTLTPSLRTASVMWHGSSKEQTAYAFIEAQRDKSQNYAPVLRVKIESDDVQLECRPLIALGAIASVGRITRVGHQETEVQVFAKLGSHTGTSRWAPVTGGDPTSFLRMEALANLLAKLIT